MSPTANTIPRTVSAGCHHVHAVIRNGHRPDTPELLAHIEACPSCAEVVQGGPKIAEALDAPLAAFDDQGLDSIWETIESAVQRERGPVAWLRSRPTPWRVVLAILGTGMMPLLVWLTWRRVDIDVYPTERWIFDLIVLLGPAFVAIAVVMRPLYRPAWPSWVERIVLAAAVVGMLMGSVLMPAHQAHPASLLGVGDTLIPRAMGCFTVGTLLGMPLLLWMSVLLRRSGRWSLPIVLAAVGSSMVGAVSIFMHCPLVAPQHLLLGHATIFIPFFVLAQVGRLPRPRPSQS